jgi:hypothetical protein
MEKKDSDMEIKNVKSWIIFLLLKNPTKVRDLKDKLIFERKLQLKDFYYHMNGNGNKEWGLKSSKIIKEKNGYLFLNLETKDDLANIIELLLKDEQIGPKLDLIFKKAFVEAFFSYYGDGLNLIQKLERFLFSRIQNFHLNQAFFERISKLTGNDIDIFPDVQNSIKSLLKTITDKELKYWDELNQNYNDENLLNLLFDFAVENRNYFVSKSKFEEKQWKKNNLKFQISYIIYVLNLNFKAEEIEKEYENKKIVKGYYMHVSDFSLFSISSEEIFNNDLSKEALNIFIEKIIKKAFDKNFSFEKIKDQKILDLLNGQVYKFLYYYKWVTNSIFSNFFMSNFVQISNMIFELEENPTMIKTKKRRKELFGNSILYSPY